MAATDGILQLLLYQNIYFFQFFTLLFLTLLKVGPGPVQEQLLEISGTDLLYNIIPI